ncbi:maltose ABC transporter substrate-binding protein [Paenibacillus sp.]|jgi:arabinogalactan oligomer/maltooligosaccharide transport system substrate-binding protein|uniref:sugar ABC transporter substrate-binding protein n=1 Tax=Paenibacillus sp. TaxID=58172 RepID=UPI002824A2AA|nr:maltose ABC transporter substrate-binding protein [Paenibacillus sp.]MDR0269054.1 maltose ABC transporter substrate-binding protein [Paenibacillus sp.]
MKMKQVMALAATLTMAFSITACGSSNKTAEEPATSDTNTETATSAADNKESSTTEGLQPEDGASLVVWDSKDERAFTDEIAKQFTAKYNIPVKIEELNPTDQVTKLTQDGPSGLAADVVIFPHDNLGRAVEAGLVLANDTFKDETIKNNTEASIQGVTIDDTLYGYPRAAETYALYYNKSILKEAPKSFDDVIAFGKTFTDNAKKKYAIMWEPGNMYFNYPFIATTGGYIFGKNGTDKEDIGINSEGALESMQTYVKLKEILPVKSGDINPDIKRSLFNSGDVAMDINGPWELSGYKTALGDKLGVAPIPSIGGKPAISFSGIKAWYVNSFTKYPNASQLFAEFASTKDAQLLLNEKVGSIPTNKEAMESDQIKNDPYVSAFAEQAKNSQPMPSIPEMGNVWSPVNAALPEIWDNNMDPKTAFDKAVQQIKDLNNGATK